MKAASKFAFMLLMSAALLAAAQRRDPLNSDEIDQLRETAQEPLKRLPLMAKFARTRMEALDRLRADAKTGSEKVAQIRDALEDFGTLIDQLGDNVDEYADQGEDLRKPLKVVVDATTEFQTKLKAWKDAMRAGATPAARDYRDYSLLLDNAIDTVDSNLENAQHTLAYQNAHADELKKKKK